MKFYRSFLMFFFFIGCTGQGPMPYGQYGQQNYGQYGQQNFPSTGQQPPYYPPRNDDDYERRKLIDEDRDSVLNDSRRRNTGDLCEDYDSEHECKDQCRSMYKRKSDRNDCEELTINQIEKLIDVHELLKEADEDTLEDIRLEDFKVYLNISIAAFDYLVGRYSRNEAKDVLTWIAENDDIAKLIQKEDDDYETLEELFESLAGSFEDNELYTPFTKSIEGSNTLMDVAIDTENETAVEWFQEFLIEKDPNCDNNDEEECFTLFCKIGQEMDKSSREDWLDYGDFEDFIDDIIRLEIGGSSSPSDGEWDTEAIEDVNDIPSDDFLNLCESFLD